MSVVVVTACTFIITKNASNVFSGQGVAITDYNANHVSAFDVVKEHSAPQKALFCA